MKYHTIDNVIFKSQADIDECEKHSLISQYITDARLFATTRNMACMEAMERVGSILVKNFGLTWADIDDIEMDALTTM